jgi:hypothetical protein
VVENIEAPLDVGSGLLGESAEGQNVAIEYRSDEDQTESYVSSPASIGRAQTPLA